MVRLLNKVNRPNGTSDGQWSAEVNASDAKGRFGQRPPRESDPNAKSLNWGGGNDIRPFLTPSRKQRVRAPAAILRASMDTDLDSTAFTEGGRSVKSSALGSIARALRPKIFKQFGRRKSSALTEVMYSDVHSDAISDMISELDDRSQHCDGIDSLGALSSEGYSHMSHIRSQEEEKRDISADFKSIEEEDDVRDNVATDNDRITASVGSGSALSAKVATDKDTSVVTQEDDDTQLLNPNVQDAVGKIGSICSSEMADTASISTKRDDRSVTRDFFSAAFSWTLSDNLFGPVASTIFQDKAENNSVHQDLVCDVDSEAMNEMLPNRENCQLSPLSEHTDFSTVQDELLELSEVASDTKQSIMSQGTDNANSCTLSSIVSGSVAPASIAKRSESSVHDRSLASSALLVEERRIMSLPSKIMPDFICPTGHVMSTNCATTGSDDRADTSLADYSSKKKLFTDLQTKSTDNKQESKTSALNSGKVDDESLLNKLQMVRSHLSNQLSSSDSNKCDLSRLIDEIASNDEAKAPVLLVKNKSTICKPPRAMQSSTSANTMRRRTMSLDIRNMNYSTDISTLSPVVERVAGNSTDGPISPSNASTTSIEFFPKSGIPSVEAFLSKDQLNDPPQDVTTVDNTKNCFTSAVPSTSMASEVTHSDTKDSSVASKSRSSRFNPLRLSVSPERSRDSRGSHSSMRKAMPTLFRTHSEVRPASTYGGRRVDARVREGDIFHVRVTLGYLSGVSTQQSSRRLSAIKKEEFQAQGYADVTASSTLSTPTPMMALSLPTDVESDDRGNSLFDIVWSKQSSADKTASRLYFSIPLKRKSVKKKSAVTSNEDRPYMPDVVNIVTGIKVGDQLLPLGVAGIVIDGKDTVNKRLDIPVQSIEQERKRLGPNYFRGMKRGVEKKGFYMDDKVYGLDRSAILVARIDVKGGNLESEGPAVWGDSINDAMSFVHSLDSRSRQVPSPIQPPAELTCNNDDDSTKNRKGGTPVKTSDEDRQLTIEPNLSADSGIGITSTVDSNNNHIKAAVSSLSMRSGQSLQNKRILKNGNTRPSSNRVAAVSQLQKISESQENADLEPETEPKRVTFFGITTSCYPSLENIDNRCGEGYEMSFEDVVSEVLQEETKTYEAMKRNGGVSPVYDKAGTLAHQGMSTELINKLNSPILNHSTPKSALSGNPATGDGSTEAGITEQSNGGSDSMVSSFKSVYELLGCTCADQTIDGNESLRSEDKALSPVTYSDRVTGTASVDSKKDKVRGKGKVDAVPTPETKSAEKKASLKLPKKLDTDEQPKPPRPVSPKKRSSVEATKANETLVKDSTPVASPKIQEKAEIPNNAVVANTAVEALVENVDVPSPRRKRTEGFLKLFKRKKKNREAYTPKATDIPVQENGPTTAAAVANKPSPVAVTEVKKDCIDNNDYVRNVDAAKVLTTESPVHSPYANSSTICSPKVIEKLKEVGLSYSVSVKSEAESEIERTNSDGMLNLFFPSSIYNSDSWSESSDSDDDDDDDDDEESAILSRKVLQAYTVSTTHENMENISSEISESDTEEGEESTLSGATEYEDDAAHYATENVLKIAQMLSMDVDELISRIEDGEDIEKLLIRKLRM